MRGWYLALALLQVFLTLHQVKVWQCLQWTSESLKLQALCYVAGLEPVLSLPNSKARERHRIIQIAEVSWNANNGSECLFLRRPATVLKSHGRISNSATAPMSPTSTLFMDRV